MGPKGIAVLGSTGSIGEQTLEVIKAFPENFKVVSLVARKDVDLIEEQIRIFQPRLASLSDNSAAAKLRSSNNGNQTVIYAGEEGLIKAATAPDVHLVVMAIPGIVGLTAVLEAIQRGKDIALASKEILVEAGDIVMREAAKRKVRILPIDSEHNAIFQCLRGEEKESIKKIILTASGGPFLKKTAKELTKVTAKMALKHPTWQMGRKVTIDSATLMNKGLEVIEAHHLFDISYEEIEVVIHPQSIIHSLIEFKDGMLKAEINAPDMRLPIQYALFYPERISNEWSKSDLTKLGELTFLKPELKKFPCLKLAYEAGKAGGSMPTALSAANDIAVELFLDEKINFSDIAIIIEKVMKKHKLIKDPSINQILEVDQWARQEASKIFEDLG